MFEKKKADCPLWRGPCKQNECRWYINLQGMNPNTGKEIASVWGCAVEFLPLLMVENAQQSRQTGAAVESFRNEMVRQSNIALTNQIKIADQMLGNGELPKLIKGN